MLTIGLAGNPNTGKSTIFNALTGGRQQVGNWPGKTVAKKAGSLRVAGQDVVLVDLPGTYSLTSYSVEEIIARNFIVEETPGAVVCIVDAANLERNLYLVVQILELGVPTILALNMSDVATRRRIQIDCRRLSTLLGGVPVIATTGSRGIGLETLKAAIAEVIGSELSLLISPSLGLQLDQEIEALRCLIATDPKLDCYPARWLAIKLLENDTEMLAKITHNATLTQALVHATARITNSTGEEPDILIADARYNFIGQAVKAAVTRPATEVVTVSDKLDRILTHQLWGLPIFFLLMWLVFQVTTQVSQPFQDFLNELMSLFTKWTSHFLGALGLGETWLHSLLVNGIIAGVGSVLAFIPILFSLYLAISILEDSGYMARAAFVMDRLMNKLGLHGKSFLPLLVGFGCTVPAIYATRTLENEHDRKVTGFLATFMSCGARLPVYTLFGAAFFGAAGGNLIFAMYVTGIGVAVLTSLLFTKVIFKNKPVPPFVMELPPYHLPQLKTVLLSTWQRTMGFVRKAGTIILTVSVVIWFLLAIPAGAGLGDFAQVDPAHSLFGTVSQALAPLFAPAGFGTWQASGALLTGFLAKEVVISTMQQTYVGNSPVPTPERPTTFGQDVSGIFFSLGRSFILTVQEVVNIVPHTVNFIPGVAVPEANFLGLEAASEEKPTALYTALNGAFSPLAAVAFCVFVLLYVPCMAATTALRHEFGLQWLLLQVSYTLGVAWLAAVLVFQVGRWLGWGV